jgi:DNA-binding transcriptional regulator YdaS (Cro superfamily)
MNGIDRAIKHFGSQAAMASALRVSQPTISEWLRGERRVPAERCPEIERETQGVVRCEDLRPDVAWDVLRMQTGQQAA